MAAAPQMAADRRMQAAGANTPTRNYRAEDGTGPNPVLDFGDPALVGGRRGGSVVSPGDPQATDPRLGVAGPSPG